MTEEITRGNGNVFADLGLPDADERLTKVKLAHEINRILDELRLKQTDIARLLGINQPKVSALMNFKLDGFSVERLMGFLVALDRDVEIVIRRKPKKKQKASLSVIAG
ncbi:MAG: helix-turn-helix domain-containing protein [Geminicoccaceae bacterium]